MHEHITIHISIGTQPMTVLPIYIFGQITKKMANILGMLIVNDGIIGRENEII
jgi:hypothetical protein